MGRAASFFCSRRKRDVVYRGILNVVWPQSRLNRKAVNYFGNILLDEQYIVNGNFSIAVYIAVFLLAGCQHKDFRKRFLKQQRIRKRNRTVAGDVAVFSLVRCVRVVAQV